MRSLVLLILTVAWSNVKGFDVSWLSVPKNDMYDPEDKIPAPVIRPDNSWKQHYKFYKESNEVMCSKFHCESEPCCEGMCIQIFDTQLCVKLPFNVGRRK